MNRSTNLITALALTAVAGLAGCRGHGQYTSELSEQARVRNNAFKGEVQMQSAQQQYLAGDIDKALKSIDNALTLAPKSAKGHTLRGRILIELGDLHQAQQSFADAQKIDANEVDSWFFMGFVHERLGQQAEALRCYQQAMKINPANPQYIVASAEMLVAQGRKDEASKLISSQSQSHAYNAGLRQLQGQIAAMEGRHADAANLYQEAALLAPEDNHIREDLARAQMRAGLFPQAEDNLSRLMKVAGNDERRDLKHMRARCLISLQRLGEARSELIALTSGEGQNDVAAWFDLGQVCVKLGDQNRLRICAKNIIANAPDSPDGYLLRAMFNRSAGSFDTALADADVAVKLAPNDPTPHTLRAVILQQLNRTEEARTAMARSLALRQSPATPAPAAGATRTATVPTN